MTKLTSLVRWRMVPVALMLGFGPRSRCPAPRFEDTRLVVGIVIAGVFD